MLRDPREGWEPNGPLRQAHQLAMESDYKKCSSKEEREFKYVFYFVKAAKKLVRSRYSHDYEYLNAMDDRRVDQELEMKERLKQEDSLECLGITKDQVDESTIPEYKEGFFDALPVENELSGNAGQLLQ